MLGKGKIFIFLLVASCQVWTNMDSSRIVEVDQGGPYHLVEVPNMENLYDDLQMSPVDYLELQNQENPILMDRIKSLRQKRDEKSHMAFRRVMRNDVEGSPKDLLGMSKHWR